MAPVAGVRTAQILSLLLPQLEHTIELVEVEKSTAVFSEVLGEDV